MQVITGFKNTNRKTVHVFAEDILRLRDSKLEGWRTHPHRNYMLKRFLSHLRQTKWLFIFLADSIDLRIAWKNCFAMKT